jgi:uncharacterized Zn finger protein (UPF0148 family)
VGAGVASVASPTAGILVGAVLFASCLLVIYLRGYLVPGTPELTKRYFPPWLLELFGKEPVTPEPTMTDIDPEEALVAAGALEECADSDDLCLTDGFRDSWVGAIERVKAEDSDRARLLDLLEVDEAEVAFQEYGSAFQARVDGTTVGKWESQAAFLADLGAGTTLADSYENWDRLSLNAKSQLLNGLRLFIDTCPSCGGTPEFGTDTVESCCSTHEVAAVACGDCDARLFETPVRRSPHRRQQRPRESNSTTRRCRCRNPVARHRPGRS